MNEIRSFRQWAEEEDLKSKNISFTFSFSLLSLDRLNKVLSIFVPGKRPQDNVKVTLDDPAEEEQAFSTISTRSSIHSFYFPANRTYLNKYHLFEGITEQEKVEWKQDYLFILKNIAYYAKKNYWNSSPMRNSYSFTAIPTRFSGLPRSFITE